MKKRYVFCLLMTCINFINGQNTINSDTLQLQKKLTTSNDTAFQAKEDSVISMLKEFYSLYAQAWHSLDENWTKQVCSLLKKYCTKSFFEDQKEEFEGGDNHDVLTADYGLDDESLATFVITKDEQKDNVYCLSYSVNTESPTRVQYKKTVQIQLEIIKVKDKYLINNVLNPYSGTCNTLDSN